MLISIYHSGGLQPFQQFSLFCISVENHCIRFCVGVHSNFKLPCSSSVLNNNYYQNEIEVVKLVFDPQEDLHNFSKLQMNAGAKYPGTTV